MPLVEHPAGQYAFLPGIAPYSGGVVSIPGFEIVHVTLDRPIPWRKGFTVIDNFLASHHRPRAALCAMELRSPAPFTFAGFGEFNTGYASVLADWGLFVDGVNPVARTNVAPETARVDEPCLFAFSYTRPCPFTQSKTFIVAGGGELPEGILGADAIIARGDVSPDGLVAKARFVMDLMEGRLHALGADWPDVSAIDIYTIHGLDRILPESLLPRIGVAARRGVVWYYTRPPIVEIEYEMDLRGVRTESRLAVE
ncbi:MAG: RidA family protein [Planctomycetota bacterium]|nr:RidA family protein [Planctomycetota bacterium]